VARTGPFAAVGVVAVVGSALGAAAAVVAVRVGLDVVFDFELPQAAAPRSSTTATGAINMRLGAWLIPDLAYLWDSGPGIDLIRFIR
jgi:hypothetical protein